MIKNTQNMCCSIRSHDTLMILVSPSGFTEWTPNSIHNIN